MNCSTVNVWLKRTVQIIEFEKNNVDFAGIQNSSAVNSHWKSFESRETVQSDIQKLSLPIFYKIQLV